MDWNPAYTWLIIALLLGLAELTSGALVLLALAAAAGLTALLSLLGANFVWQLVGMGVFSGLLLPLTIKVIRPWFSPRGVAYGTTGTGVDADRVFTTLRRDFDGACGVKINGDFYRLRDQETGETDLPAGTAVIFRKFDGTTAVVSTAAHKEQ